MTGETSEWVKIRTWFESKFSSTETAFLTLIQPFAVQVEKKGEAILVSAAETGFAAGEAVVGTPGIKMAAALAAFSASVVAQGLPYIESEARTLIELTIQKAKAATGTTGATS